MNLNFNNILPSIIGLILGSAMFTYLFYKKGEEISILRMIIAILWIGVLFGILAFLAEKIEALPYRFLACTLGSLLFGFLYFALAPMTLSWWKRNSLNDVFVLNLTLFFFGIAAFALVNNLLSGSSANNLLASGLAFLLPSVAIKSYDFWMQIPPKKYKTWMFPVHAPVPKLQPIEPIKLMMNFTPVPSGDDLFESYEVEFPTNAALSELFHYFICFHNKHREYKKKPIQFLEGDAPLEWVLFKYTPQKKKLYLDMDKTLIENQVSPNEHIYALSSN